MTNYYKNKSDKLIFHVANSDGVYKNSNERRINGKRKISYVTTISNYRCSLYEFDVCTRCAHRPPSLANVTCEDLPCTDSNRTNTPTTTPRNAANDAYVRQTLTLTRSELPTLCAAFFPSRISILRLGRGLIGRLRGS